MGAKERTMEKYKITYTPAQSGYCAYTETYKGTIDGAKDHAWQEVIYPYHVGIDDCHGNLLCYLEFWRNPGGEFGWDGWKNVEYRY